MKDMTIQEIVDLILKGHMKEAAEKLEEEGESPVDVYTDLVVICDALEMAAKRLHTFLGRYSFEKNIMASEFLARLRGK